MNTILHSLPCALLLVVACLPIPLDPVVGGTETDADGCVTACVEQEFACVNGVAWSDGPIGIASRDIQQCNECETKQIVLLKIDPLTAATTVLGEGPVNSWGGDLVVAGDGSIFVAGEYKSNFGQEQHGALFKFSPDGALVWQIKPDVLPFTDIALRGDEVVVVEPEHELSAFSAVDGAALWVLPLAGPIPAFVEVDGEGALHVAGHDTYASYVALPTWYVRKYGADQALVWEQVVTMTEADRPRVDGFGLDGAGGAVVAVRAYDNVSPGPDDITLHKLTADGASAWTRPFPLAFPDTTDSNPLHEIVARPGGGVFLLGGLSDGATAYTIALDPDGEVVWDDLVQMEGLGYASNKDAVIGDGALRVVGCGYSELGEQGWLLSFAP